MSIVVNGGAAQRSRVTKVAVPAADFPNGAFLMRADGLKILPLQTTVGANIELTFVGVAGAEFGSLPDGRWWVLPIQAHLHRLFGDGDGNSVVDLTDFGLFGQTFGKGNAQPGFNWAFDHNDDGVVNLTDFAAFGQRFGTGV